MADQNEISVPATQIHEPLQGAPAAPTSSVGAPSQWSRQIPRWVPYAAACLCTATSSGGLILGVGPFSASLIDEGYVSSDQVSTIFTGAFQIMTWGSMFAVHVESRVGPRISAAIGTVISFAGHAILANMPIPVNPYIVMVGYGLLGWGGNHIFFSCFQFAQLFPLQIGLAAGFMSGLFNLAGCFFLILNIPGMSIKLMFNSLMGVLAAMLAVILAMWPDRSYQAGDSASMSFPTLKYTKNIFAVEVYRKGFPFIWNLRYAFYALGFSWACLVQQYVSGNLVLYQEASTVGNYYLKWAYPLIANPTCLFSWSVGHVIDRAGFAQLSLLLIILGQVALWCLYCQHSTAAAWIVLVCMNWMCAIQYTIEFAFLLKVLPSEAFSAGLLTVLFVQGSFGFIANPGLSPNPWGDDYLPAILGLSVIALPLAAWPIMENKWHRQDAAEGSEIVGGGSIISSVFNVLESAD